MNTLIQDATGLKLIALSPAEVLAAAQAGNIEAIREIIAAKGGWSMLTAAQKDAVFQLEIGLPAVL